MRKTFRLLVAMMVVLGLTALSVAVASSSPQARPESCGTCHEREYEEWARSAHARAGESEAFTGLTETMPGASSGWGEDACFLCHAPLAAASDPSGGVSCQVCHFMESTAGMGNGDFVLSDDGVVRGPRGKQAPHPAVASDLLTDSRFCATCHEQYHPVTGALLQGTYSEWLASPAASQGVGCQDCHMRSGDGAGHEFAPQAETPEAKASALGEAISMNLAALKSLKAGDFGVIEVTLRNVGAGHSLPTGKNEAHEMWLEVTAETSDGDVLHRERLSYGVVYENADGEHGAAVSLWDAAGIFVDHRLSPQQVVAEQFSFAVPVDARGIVEISAILMYRSRPSWLSEALELPEAAAVPIHAATAQIEILPPRPSPTYIPPTPKPTPAKLPTSASGGVETVVRAEGRGWIAPFLAVGGCALLLVGAWAFRRRAV